MILNEEFITGIDDSRFRPFRAGISQKMLDMGADAELRRGKTGSGGPVSRRTEAAEVILIRRHVTAISKVACLLQGLTEGYVGTDAFAAGFVVISLYDVF